MIICDEELVCLDGTFLSHESILSQEWCLKEKDITLVLTKGPSSAALAFKVWPYVKANIKEIVYAGGTLGKGDATPFAEKSIYMDPFGMESLLNSGIPVVLCTLEKAESLKMTSCELAKDYALHKEKYEGVLCGAHVETDRYAKTYGKVVCDINADKKFLKKNAIILKN